MPIDYSKGKVYCIRNLTENDKIVYVGSTVRTLSERMSQHRQNIKRYPTFKIYAHMAQVGIEHFHIELLVDFPCERKEQLLAEEGRHIRLNNLVDDGLNTHWTGRTRAETVKAYSEKNSVKIKEYIAAHKDGINANGRKYHVNHREERNAKCATYKETHHEETKAYNAEYRAKNLEKLKAYQKEYKLRKKAERAAQAQAMEAIPPE